MTWGELASLSLKTCESCSGCSFSPGIPLFRILLVRRSCTDLLARLCMRFPSKNLFILASGEAGAAPQVSQDAAASVRGLKHHVPGLPGGFACNNGTLSGFLCGQSFL